MYLLVVNYPEEIDLSRWKRQSDVEVLVLKEQKGSLFAMKLLKHLESKKYDLVIHYGLCGGQREDQLGQIYQIDRTFLWDDHIIDNQHYAIRKPVDTAFPRAAIVTKFRIGAHSDELYQFGSLYDLESFRVAQASCLTGQQIVTLKGVSDLNDIACVQQMSEDEEIDFLLYPEKKRTKKQMLLGQLQGRIDLLNERLKSWREEEKNR